MVTTRHSTPYTVAALRSFFHHTPLARDDAFLLIDNDGAFSWEGIEAPIRDRVTLHVNPAPLSCSQNGNRILQAAHARNADAIWMNNDIIFTRGWLQPICIDTPAVITPTCNQNFQYRTDRLTLKSSMTLEEFRAGANQLPAIMAEHRKRHTQIITAYKTTYFCVRIPPTVYRSVGLLETSFGIAGGEDEDYCIRSYLAGFPVLVATASYLIHFAGRSTWSGPESREQWVEREKSFIANFRRKWGPSLCRFLVYKDASLLDQHPNFREAETSGGIAALFREMAHHDGIAVEELLAKSQKFS